MVEGNPIILLVENEPTDILLTQRALKTIGCNCQLEVFTNGHLALEHLTNSANPSPWLIIVDLNIPRINGIQLIKTIKKEQKIWAIPIVVLSNSQSEADIEACFLAGAGGYLTKPLEFPDFVDTIKTILQYWSLNRLPGSEMQKRFHSCEESHI